MKRLLSFFTLALFVMNALVLPARAQSAPQLTRISGKITDSAGAPLASATILLLHPGDSLPLRTTLTDEKGSWQITNVSPGTYSLQYSSIGFETWTSPLLTLSTGLAENDQGTHPLQKEERTLRDVVITAAKPLYQQRPDGIVVNVAASVMTKGSSALEVLERSPGLVIDRRNSNILLNGKDGVLVMLNGKLIRMPLDQLVTLLNGMSANDIEKIELLSSPPANYDAEGSAGIINIVLKKSRRPGTNGSLSLTGGYGWREKATAGMNISHNTGRITSSASYTFSHDHSRGALDGSGSMDFPPLGGQMNNFFWSSTQSIQNNHNAAFSLDAAPTPKMTIGASFNYYSSSNPAKTVSRGEYHLLPDSALIFEGNTDATSHWNNLAGGIYIEKLGREGEKMGLGIDYLRYANSNASDIISSFNDIKAGQPVTADSLYSPQQRSLGHILIRVGILKLDYKRSLSKSLQWETGIKGNIADSRSSSAVEGLVDNAWTVSLGTASSMRMREAIAAAYTTFTARLNARITLAAGLRYEYADTRTDDRLTGKTAVNRQQGLLFPNIALTGKISDRSEWQLSWSKRISRPSYNDLASFVEYNDPVAVNTGNPALRPTISNNLKLGYNYRNYSFSILAGRDDHPINRYQLTESRDHNVMIIGPQNALYQNMLNIQVSLPFRVTPWWSMTYSFVGGWRQIKEDYTKYPFGTTFFGYSANFSQLFTLPHDYTIEISGWHNGGGYNGSSWMNGFGSLNMGIKKELSGNHGTLQLSVSDMLSTLRYSGTHGYNTTEAFNSVNHWYYNPESRFFPIFRLTYTRSFGISSGKGATRQGNTSADEKDRIRQ